MITAAIPASLYPGLAHDGGFTFAGVLQSYFTIKDVTGQNVGISRRWNDNTAAQYLRDYTERILPTISRLLGAQKPMHEYLESDFEAVLSDLKSQYHYAESSIMHYRHLLWSVYSMGVSQNLYDDNIYWDISEDEDDAEKKELNRAHSLTRIRKSLSISEDIRMLLWYSSLDPRTATGEDLGLALMYFLGLRGNEACGASFGDIRLMSNHQDMAVFTMGNTTNIASNILKASGKTGNAPRQLPLCKYVYHFLQKRKEWIQGELDAGRIILPQNIDSIDKLPIACKGSDITKRSETSNLSKSGRALFQKIGISKSELAVLHRVLLSVDFQDTVIDEKEPTTYLLRRNTATRHYHLGFDWEVIQYWIAHDIESPLLKRDFFSDEETLHELGKKYEQHPIFHILAILNGESSLKTVRSPYIASYSLDASRPQIIDIEANEPNQPVFISLNSESAFSVVQTEKESSNSTSSLITVGHLLHKAYLQAFQNLYP